MCLKVRHRIEAVPEEFEGPGVIEEGGIHLWRSEEVARGVVEGELGDI